MQIQGQAQHVPGTPDAVPDLGIEAEQDDGEMA